MMKSAKMTLTHFILKSVLYSSEFCLIQTSTVMTPIHITFITIGTVLGVRSLKIAVQASC